MKTNKKSTLVRDFLQKSFQHKFEKGFDRHYAAGEIYPENYDGGLKDRLYMQREFNTRNLRYWRIDLSIKVLGKRYGIDNLGISFRYDGTVDGWWFMFRLGTFHVRNPFKLYKEWRKRVAERKRIQELLDSDEYVMDPMGVIHHKDDDQAAHYE